MVCSTMWSLHLDTFRHDEQKRLDQEILIGLSKCLFYHVDSHFTQSIIFFATLICDDDLNEFTLDDRPHLITRSHT
jgi:hypothetical protein